MTDDLTVRRNIELFVRHCAGESYRSLGASHGISGACVEQIVKRAAARLASHLPVTLPTARGAWTVARKRGSFDR